MKYGKDYFNPMYINITEYGNFQYFISAPNTTPCIVIMLKSIYDPFEVDGESSWAHWHGIKE